MCFSHDVYLAVFVFVLRDLAIFFSPPVLFRSSFRNLSCDQGLIFSDLS